MISASSTRRLSVILIVLVSIMRPVRAQQASESSVARVKNLYESAAYEEALGELDQMIQHDPQAAQGGRESRALQQYRALCLLALNRTIEAEQGIERMIMRDPEYQPDLNETSPRLASIVSSIRNRVMPVLARRQYESAKALFDRRQYTEAGAEFARVIARLDDGLDPATVAATSDLRVLATGFLDLSRAALLQARPLTVWQPPEVIPSSANRVWTQEDRDVVPPVSIRQELPKWLHQPFGVDSRFEGEIDVVIDEKGEVESVTLAKSIQPSYDDLAVAAAKTWKYSPATKDGIPVKFRKSVGVLLVAEQR